MVKILNTLEVAQLLADSTTVSDGMRPKLSACLNAVNGGVSLAQIVNGNLAQSLLTAVQNPLQIGTSIIKGDPSC